MYLTRVLEETRIRPITVTSKIVVVSADGGLATMSRVAALSAQAI
jgi:hypothetical protein